VNKRDFIQRVLIRTCPPEAKIDKGIVYAEHLWSRLDAAGYGNGEKGKPKDYVDNYELVKDKDGFDKFWNTFGVKKGKTGAAKRWNQINPDQELVKKIIAAARKENESEHNGSSRKWPEGWLHERRYEDIDVTVTQSRTHGDNGLQNARRMLELSKGNEKMTEVWQKEIDKLSSAGKATEDNH